MKMNPRANGILGGAAVLLIGVALGIVLDRTVLVPPHSEASTAQDHAAVLASLTADLHLSDAQVAQVREILDRHQATVTAAWQDTHRTLKAALDSVTTQVEAVLEPDQIEEYHEWIDRRHPTGDPRRPSHDPH